MYTQISSAMTVTVIFLIFLQILNLVLCSSKTIVELEDVNFSSTIAAHEVSLIMFYAPWCRHCQDLKPQFEEAASELHTAGINVMLASVDCTGIGKKTCKREEISGYPTLKIYKKGIFYKEYDGPRDADGIEYYMTQESEISPKNIFTKYELNKFLSSPQACIMGFFKNESNFKDDYIKLAKQLKSKIKFGITSSPENLMYENKVVLFRPQHLQNKFESNAIVFDDETIENMESFISKYKHGLVGHRTKKNINEFQNPLVVAYFNVDYQKNPKGTNYWRNRIMLVAQSFSKHLSFAISAVNEFPHELTEFGYEYDQAEDKPIIFLRDKDNKKYKMNEEFSLDNFEKFLTKFLAGKVEPYVKSSPLPDNTDQLVKVAVANNFEEVVVNNGKDTFINFYAPWCNYCKKMEPTFNELGEKMAEEDISIVKMDAANNDIPFSYKIEGYPSLYWSPKNSKNSPIKYNGGRELNDFIKFIAKHSTEELKSYDREGSVKVRQEL